MSDQNQDNNQNTDIKIFSNQLPDTDKIFSKSNTRYIVATFHNLPPDYHVQNHIIYIRDIVQNKLNNLRRPQRIEKIIVTKEPYNYEKYPHQAGKMHLHALFILAKKIKIRSHKNVAKLFAFEYESDIFYPHVSLLYDYNGYLNYITKLQQTDPKTYNNPEYYAEITGEHQDKLKQQLDTLLRNINTAVKNDLTAILGNYNYEQQIKHMGFIKHLLLLLPSKRSRIEDIMVDMHQLKYHVADFTFSSDMPKVKEIAFKHLKEPQKTSLVVYGEPNMGKSAMIKAIVKEYVDTNPDEKVYLIIIKNIQSLIDVDIHQLQNYDKLILSFEDIDYNEGDIISRPDAIKNLFEGPLGNSAIRILYSIFTFTGKMIKIFSMNTEAYQEIQKLANKYKGINERMHPYQMLDKYIQDLNLKHKV